MVLPRRRSSLFFAATLVAGSLDLLYAFTYYGARGIAPERILQSVASGLLGRASFSHGWRSALLGLLCQFVIAGLFTAAYMLASERLPWLRKHFVWAGVAYGAVIYLVMHFVVLPLSAAPRTHPRPLSVITDVLAHLLLIGLPIAVITTLRWSSGAGVPTGNYEPARRVR